tara:strand:+ start:8282 stop:10357 length:2076 start_codon:yes stop_codon:yes gene_type:complete
MKNDKTLKVLLIDPCFSDRGISNIQIPLSVGLIASYLKNQIPEIDVCVLKSSEDIEKYIRTNKPDVLGSCNYLWNTNIANRLSNYARELNPKTLIVYGGPEINQKPVDSKNFINKYKNADMLVEHEGEIAFYNIIKIFLEEGCVKEKLKNRINELGNCFYIDEKDNIISGPKISRIKDLNLVPSPYLTGILDKFLNEGTWQPLIQTNRGCPYACTFCQEGSGYYNKINYHSLEYVKEELNYIAERIDPAVGLFIVDSNFGMYKQDVEVALHLKELKNKYNWPQYIHVSTGKSQLQRIKHVAEILDGALMITNAVQSLNNDVLDEIKRKNANNLEESIMELDKYSEPDIILPLPKETLHTFVDGLSKLVDIKAPVRLSVCNALMLSNTQMNDNETQEKNKLKVTYRQHQNETGWVAGKLISETERNIVATSTMSEKDVLEARKYVVLLDAMLREEPFAEIFYYLDTKKVKRSTLTMSLYDNLDKAPKEIQECFNQYIKEVLAESFETETEVFEYMKKYGEDYAYGKKGGDLLRYSQKLWIDHFDSMIEWIFKNLDTIFIKESESRNELGDLKLFYLFVYNERSNSSKKNINIIKQKFNFDILKWHQDKTNKQLGEYKKEVVYFFEETKFSNVTNQNIWNSFGFNLTKDSNYIRSAFSRLYLSRTRRTITREDGLDTKQRLPLMSNFAEKVGL